MIVKRISGALVVAAVFLGLSAALRVGVTAEWLSADAARRAIQVLVGLMLAGYANFMPKDTGPWPYAALWAFAPIGVADVVSLLVVATAMIVTVAYAARAFIACRRTQRNSTVPV